MNLRDIFIKENETLLSTEGQQPHNFAAKSQVGQGIEWPKAAGGTTPAKQERDEVEMPGDHHVVHHGDDSHHGGDGVSESIVNEVGGNYLFHATGGLKGILQSGVINAALAPQTATSAQTKLPTVSTTRDWGYASGSNAAAQAQGGIARGAVLVLDRAAVEQRYKTLGTSQNLDTRGLAFAKKKNFNADQYKFLKPFDVNKDNKLSKDELDAWQQQTGGKAAPGANLKVAADDAADAYQDRSREFAYSKAGGEFEEAIPVKNGQLPIKGILVGFWVNPKSQLVNDPEIMNHPLRLERSKNQFVRVNESAVMEDGEATSTVSSDIATVSYPLLVRGRTRREKRKNARAAVGQSYVPGPAYIGQGVFEGAFDNASPMTKDSINRDRVRSLKNLIAIYTEKGDKNKVRELKKELELLVVERLGEASLATMRDYFAGQGDGYDPSKLATMRDYFNKIGGNNGIPPNIKRIIQLIKNNEKLRPEEFQQFKMWQQNRQKTQEAHVIDHQNVIYRLDREKPMSDTEVLVLGGAGRYTLDGLRRKARREADELAQDLKIEHGGSFRRAAENIKQLTNTLNTIVAAYNELRRIRKKGGRGSRGITDEEANFIRECSDQMALLDHYTQTVKRAQRIAEGIQHYLKEDKMRHEHASTIKGMFHLNTDPGYGFYRYAIHVAGNHGGDKVVLGPNAGPFAYAYTDAEAEMIRDAVKAITGREPLELTGGKSKEPDFVNKNSTVPSIDWKKVK